MNSTATGPVEDRGYAFPIPRFLSNTPSERTNSPRCAQRFDALLLAPLTPAYDDPEHRYTGEMTDLDGKRILPARAPSPLHSSMARLEIYELVIGCI